MALNSEGVRDEKRDGERRGMSRLGWEGSSAQRQDSVSERVSEHGALLVFRVS